jgi:hypothetical protein
MQVDALDPETFPCSELGVRKVFSTMISIRKMNAGELATAAELNTQPLEFPARIRHQPFAACLVDRRNKGIRHHHVKPMLAQCYARSQTSGITADNQSVTGQEPWNEKRRTPRNKRNHSTASPFNRIDGLTPQDVARIASAATNRSLMNKAS